MSPPFHYVEDLRNVGRIAFRHRIPVNIFRFDKRMFAEDLPPIVLQIEEPFDLLLGDDDERYRMNAKAVLCRREPWLNRRMGYLVCIPQRRAT